MKRQQRSLTAAERKAIEALYPQGHSIREVAEAVNRPPTSVRRHLKRKGLLRPVPVSRKMQGRAKRDPRISRGVELVLNRKMTLTQAASVAGCNAESLRCRLLRRGVRVDAEVVRQRDIRSRWNQIQAAVALREARVSTDEAARRLGITESVYRRLLREYTEHTGIDVSYEAVALTYQRKAYAMHVRGASVAEIADALGYTEVHVRTWRRNWRENPPDFA